MQDDFYIGYLKKAPSGLARFVRVASAIVFAGVLAVGALAALGQHLLPRGVFEYGVTTELEGEVVAGAVPRIVVESGSHPVLSPGVAVVLVGEGKRGAESLLPPGGVARARVGGTLIHDGTSVMLEVHEITPRPAAGDAATPGEFNGGEERTIEGELVDTKCFLGAMRPGRGKVHRGCAIACLEGGIPAGLWVKDGNSEEGHLVFIANDEAYRSQVSPEWAGLRVRVQGRYTVLDGVRTIYVREATRL